MRCPQCNQRNSIAASVCEFCKEKFGNKPIRVPVIVAGGVILIACLAFALWSYLYPKIADPEIILVSCAKQVSNGPDSPAQANELNKQLKSAIQNYLQAFGNSDSTQLLQKLQSLLPSNAFEVNVIDLPRAMKIVEIDTVLQATTYLVMPSSGKDASSKIFSLSGLEVFDDGRIIKDAAGPMLILIGHSGGQPPHRPQIKTYALLPDDLMDETAKLIPEIKANGTAKFAKNNSDIAVELSLISVGQSENIFGSVSPREDSNVLQHLKWKGDKYVSTIDYGTSPLQALYALTKSIKYPEAQAEGQKVNKTAMAGNGAVDKFEIVREKMNGGKGTYIVKETSSNNTYKLSLAKKGNGWLVVSINPVQINEIAKTTETVLPVVQEPVPTPELTKVAELPQAVANDKAKIVETKNNEIKAEANTKEKESVKENIAALLGPAHVYKEMSSDTIMLRSAPSTQAKVYDQIGKGAALNIVGKANGWYKVSYNGKQGYVYAGLVDFDKPEAYTTAVVTKTKALRDHNQKQVANSHIGDRVVVLGGIHNNKYKVQLASGKTVYLDKDALDVAVETPQFVP